ncbi:hypothetical protein MtrunA17_Chr4g0040171 [Medicago truncatula]|uniref:DUF506 family protein n=1 Tax=Medicago truncatula TaxID=3880 RepID=G7JTT3_MEDTR|nr:uncharacterized protein LOC11438646 [Medicago truncatula]AES89662.1 DUF506 family protein [Medicago truncatula]RHN61763.1 hypothetical protein MtrunA17_Chr4g0040171 [Medicago truncatula]
MGKELSATPAATYRSSDEVSFADTVFGFWEEFQDSSENSSNSGNDEEIDDEEDEDSVCTIEKNKAFWEEQDQLLKATLCRTSSGETKVRQATKEAMREINMSEMLCLCRQPVVSCRKCLLTEICDRLVNLGFNSAICKSKWKSSSEIPSGEHTYLEVTENSSKAKGGVIKVIIELNFRGEFEMARGNEEYNQLVKRLPEIFVGKAERLRVLVKIMCSAAKKCMKEKKLHLGPWRKQKYMQAKWNGKCDKILEPLPIVYSTRSTKPKASLLTFDLMIENIVGRHCTAVEVV